MATMGGELLKPSPPLHGKPSSQYHYLEFCDECGSTLFWSRLQGWVCRLDFDSPGHARYPVPPQQAKARSRGMRSPLVQTTQCPFSGRL